MPQTSSDSGNIPVLSEIEVAGANGMGTIFDWKLLNSGFCACAVKICLKVF